MHFFGMWKLRWLWSLAIVCCATLMILGSIRRQSWVGRKDLAVQFHVVDSRSGQSVSRAFVHVRAAPGGGFCADLEPHDFTAGTDGDGQSELICKQCMCSGSRGMFEDTFSSHLPSWWVHATAPGYHDSVPVYLVDSEFVNKTDRGTAYATVSIPIVVEPLPR